MSSKAIIAETAASKAVTETASLINDLARHIAMGLEAHANTRVLVGTPFLDTAGKIVSNDTLRIKTVKADGTAVLVDVPIVAASSASVSDLVESDLEIGDPVVTVPPETIVTSTSTESTGGGGCLLRLTKILLPDGSSKRIEEISVGDELMAYGFKGLSTAENSWETFHTANLAPVSQVTRVKSVEVGTFDSFYVFTLENGLVFRSTWEHLIFYEHDWLWKFGHAKDVQVGDYLAVGRAKVKVVKKINVESMIQTYNIDVEPYDTYIADGIIVHNSVPRVIKFSK